MFSGHRYTWAFLLADVQFNILGVDFLQNFQLLVDVAANGLWPALSTAAAAATAVSTTATTALLQSPTSLPTVEALELPFVNSTTAVNPQADSNTTGVLPKLTKAEADILQDFSDVLNAEGRLPPSTHRVEHHLITEGWPVTAKFRAAGQYQASRRKRRISPPGAERHHPAVQQRLGQPSTYGPES